MLRIYLVVSRQHDLRMVALAALICLLATFTAFAAFDQSRHPRASRSLWVGLAAAVAGVGIWTTHFVAMLAFEPGMPVEYDFQTTLVSIAAAIGISAVGWTVARASSAAAAPIGGAIIGLGICVMHFVGMSAMRMPASVRWDHDLLITSIGLGVGLSAIALSLHRWCPRSHAWPAAVTLFFAICATHFTGVASATLQPYYLHAVPAAAVNGTDMGIAVAAAAALILSISFGLIVIDRSAVRVQLLEARERAILADEVLKLATDVMESAAERDRLAEDVKRQADIGNAALDHMAQGLSMYDREDRLVTSNRRYSEIYGVPPHLLSQGTPYVSIIDYLISNGTIPGKTLQFVKRTRNAATKSHSTEIPLKNGRIINVQRRPLPQGGWVATHEDVTEIREAGRRIAFLAAHDVLTGLPNRATFKEVLQEASSNLEVRGGFAVHTIDLDRFKELNDTLGHPIGDQILKQVAERLRTVVGNCGFVTRMGGDEFAVLQLDVERPEDAADLAARIIEAVGESYRFDGHTMAIGASVGISLAPRHGRRSDELLKRSDLALYRAKSDSRGTFRFFERGMDSRLQRRRELEIDLQLAVQHGQFEVHYQPLLDLVGGTIQSFEALLRWNHPTRGMVQPADFIGIAEESGLIIPIGEWTLRQACRDASTWPSDVNVAVNLSPAQFKRGDLVAMIRSALDAAALAPTRLELEVTESVLLHDEEWVRSILQRLTDLGISIAMDDFGTGYSSLSYLRTFPFAKIKIDRSFVADVVGAPDSLAIVQATIHLSRKLGLKTTAEGVETVEQLEMLAAEGCTEVQGFHVSPAVPASQVPGLLGMYGSRQLRAVG
jgi:diguanylate cyclase (GGDEF)-like protein